MHEKSGIVSPKIAAARQTAGLHLDQIIRGKSMTNN